MSTQFFFGARSKQNLKGVHPDLVHVAIRALVISKIDFVVTEGRRSMARQNELFQSGATTTMNSRHLTGHAIDIAPYVGGQIRWDWPLFYQLADAMKQAAVELGVGIEWGGDWKTFKDGPHFQLSWKLYPA